MPMRPASSTCIALTKPWPSSPSSWSAGTRQSVNTTSLVSLARMPSLFSFLPGRMPGVPRSMMNAEMPRLPRARSVTAIATNMPPIAPCVMNVLAPLITQLPSPSRTAVVRVPAASLPAVGSVRPHAPSISPCASGGRKRCFCASVPNMKMCAEQRPLCAATLSATAGQTRASSSMQRQ